MHILSLCLIIIAILIMQIIEDISLCLYLPAETNT